MSKRAGNLLQYFRRSKVPKVTGNNDPEPEEEEMEGEDERQALLPVEHHQVEDGKNGKEAEEDPYAQLNQILLVSSYITNAAGHVSRQITFYQNIYGCVT